MYKKILVFIFIFQFSGCIPDKKAPTEVNPADNNIFSEATTWIRNNAIEISDVERTGVYSDLASLDSILSNVRIVALGEVTYGTHECSKIKTRLVDFLVNNLGFNVILFDSDFPESESINQYIKTGQGELNERLFSLLYWRSDLIKNNLFWYSQEISDFFHWMNKYNQFLNDEDKLILKGFGVQRPQKAMNEVINYFQIVDSASVNYVMNKYNRFINFCYRYPVVGNYVMSDCRNGTIAVRDTLEANRFLYEPISGIESFEKILFLANYVIRSEQVLRNNMEDLENQYRFEMIKKIINESPYNSKFIIWAQNNSVGYFPNKLGAFLKSEYGQDILNIGFSMYNGYFFASLLNPDDGSYSLPCLFENPVPPENSFETILHSCKIPYFMLDINSNLEQPGSPATDWLYSHKMFNTIEKFYEPNASDKYFTDLNLRNIFDIIVHIDTTSVSELFIY